MVKREGPWQQSNRDLSLNVMQVHWIPEVKHYTKTKHSCSKALLLTRSAAHGIIVPLLYNENDARKIVQAAKFPPRGNRGFGSYVKFQE